MDYKEKYKSALEKAEYWHKEGYGRGCQEVVEDIFPELKESEDERIRKELIKLLDDLWEDKQGLMTDRNDYERYIAWLEKHKYTEEEIVTRCKKSWYNEGKIDGQFEGITDDVKYQQGWHDALEKQGKNPCNGCNNTKGCVTCVDGSEWAHIEEQNPVERSEEDTMMIDNILGTYKTLEDMLDLSTEQDKDLLDSMNFERNWLKSLKGRLT